MIDSHLLRTTQHHELLSFFSSFLFSRDGLGMIRIRTPSGPTAHLSRRDVAGPVGEALFAVLSSLDKDGADAQAPPVDRRFQSGRPV